MALQGFEQFNPGGSNAGSFGGIPSFGGGNGPQSFNSMPSNFGQGAAFEPADPMKGLNLDFASDPLQEGGGIDWSKILLGGKDAGGNESMGALSGGLSALTGIGNAILGYKQYGLAKKELAFQQEQAGINNRNQMTTLNNLMRGQADNRAIATGGQSLSGDAYVQQHGIKL